MYTKNALNVFLSICHHQARVCGECVGAIVCKLDYHRGRGAQCKRGYIAMLAVDERHRKRRIGSTLVRRAIRAMQAQDADEVSTFVRESDEASCTGWG